MRRALVKVASVDDGCLWLLPAAPSVLTDHGLTIEDHLRIDRRDGGSYIILLISGDALPEECEQSDAAALTRVVDVAFERHAYGSQSMTRVHSIQVVNATILDLLPFH